MRSFSGDRKSAHSGKKLKIGSLTLRISPRSIAIPIASDATLFETDFTLCRVSALKTTFFTRLPKKRPGTSSGPLKYRSKTSLPLRATSTECMFDEAASSSAILQSAPPSMSLSSLLVEIAHPSGRALGAPQPSDGSANAGNPWSDASAAPPTSEQNWRRLIFRPLAQVKPTRAV